MSRTALPRPAERVSDPSVSLAG